MYWTKEEDRVIIENYYHIQVKEIVALLPGRTEASIGLRAKRTLGLNEDKRTQRKYKVNMNFFDEPSITNSYWAGFIAADGCLTIKKHLVSFGIHWDDGYLLEQFVRDIGFEGRVNYNITRAGQRRASLYIWGVKTWFSPLKKYFNLEPKKSLTLKAPNLKNNDHIKAYIRGYIDGDGGIYEKYGLNTWAIKIRGTNETLNFIRKYFDTWVSEKLFIKCSQVNDYDYEKISSYKVTGKRSLMLLKELLQVSTPYLTRKWDPVINHLNNFPSPLI